MKKYLVVVFIGAILIFYFTRPRDPVGVYVAKNFINTIDTLFVKEDGTFTRVIYQSDSQGLLFSNRGKWEYDGKRIVFDKFFPNDDEKLKFGYDFKSTLLVYSVPLEKSFGREVLEYNETSGKYTFYKVCF